MKHFTTSLLALSLALSFAAGCYDAGEKADCVGLSCGNGLDWPDGGEVRILYVRYPDGTEWRYMVAYFIEEQNPEKIDLGPLNACSPDVPFDAERRDYFDAGEYITINMPDGPRDLPRFGPVTDLAGRMHDIAYISETYDPTTPDFFNAYHSATLQNEDLDFSNMLTTIYVPPAVEVLEPLPDEAGVVYIKRDQDLVVRWQNSAPAADGVMTAAEVLFIDVTAVPVPPPMTCIGLNIGYFLVPKETIAEIPDTGLFQVGSVADEAILTPEERRIDLWGTNCIAFTYQLID